MKLPKSFTTVTPLSKALAMVLFVLLPFVGFFFGYRYHQSLSPPSVAKRDQTSAQPAQPTIQQVNDTYRSDWKTYHDNQLNFTLQYYPNWEWEDGAQADLGHFYCASSCSQPNKDLGNNFIAEFSVNTTKTGAGLTFEKLIRDQRSACRDFYTNQSDFYSLNGVKIYEVCDSWWVQSTKHPGTILIFRSEHGNDHSITREVVLTLSLDN